MSTIALVVEASSGGTGTHVTDLARQLLRRGHSVHLLYGVARSDQRFLEAVAAMTNSPNFRSQVFHVRHDISLSDFSAVIQLARYLKSEGPFDVVHAHSTKAGLVGRMAAWLVGVPAVYTPHGVMAMNASLSPVRRKAAAWLERLLAHISSRVIAVSCAERAQLLQSGLAFRSIQFIPNGIDLPDCASPLETRNRVREQLGLAEHEICVGFIGRLVKEKNLELLLTAFRLLLDRHPHSRLIVVGDGPLRAQLETLARKLEIDTRVTWSGYVEAMLLLPGFDLLALSSVSESWPYALMEALAAGLPVVATDIGGIPELVRSGHNGFLVPPEDAERFAEALARLAADSALRDIMGANALRTIRKYSIESMTSQIEQVYFAPKQSMRPVLVRLGASSSLPTQKSLD